MLTKNDLQAIQGLIREEVNPIKKDIGGLMTDVSGLKTDIEDVKKQVEPIKTIKRDVKRLLRDRDYMSKAFDEGIVYLGRRVERIEEHLKLSNVKQPQHN